MRSLGKRTLGLAATLAVLLVMIGVARADDSCHKIDAKGQGEFTGPTSTASEITGNGLVNGTTTASLNITGVAGPGILTFNGILVLTTKHGTLTLAIINGLYDTLTGEFSNDSIVVDGTGRFEDATGGLYFHGFVLADGIDFIDDEISGEICLDD
jgi:hypothetical protein